MLIQVERLKALPVRLEETWQGGFLQVPSVDRGQADPRPDMYMPIWLSVELQTVNKLTDAPVPADLACDQSLTALVDFAENNEATGFRPGQIEASDPKLAEFLESKLAGSGVRVVHKPEGLEPLDLLIEQMQKMVGEGLGQVFDGGDPFPPMLSAEGVTVDHIRAFAQAACGFYEAAPWEGLSDEDLIHIHLPQVPQGLGWCTVLGAGGQTFGIGFYDSREQYQAIHQAASSEDAIMDLDPLWSIQFATEDDFHPEDVDLWREQDFALAGPDAYPTATAFSFNLPQQGRPDAKQLAWMEGVLRVLTQATSKQLDQGKWQATVRTAEGPMTFKLSLPDMSRGWGWVPAQDDLPDPRSMERMVSNMHRIVEERGIDSPEELQEMMASEFQGKAVPNRPGQTPLELAQDLVYDATECVGRRQVKLAKQALKICPDCADAYVLLAENAGSLDKQLELYTQGVQAGERALGLKAFQEDAGHFWGILETRPYMRAKLGLARCLENDDRIDEAIKHYREMLRLNPNDNQGVREVLSLCLLYEGRDAEVLALAKRYPDDFLALPRYIRALVEFRLSGNSPAARKALHNAVKVNSHVPALLLEELDPLPESPATFAPGSEQEAVLCVEEIERAWVDTPGALGWLSMNISPSGPAPKRYKQRKRRSR